MLFQPVHHVTFIEGVAFEGVLSLKGIHVVARSGVVIKHGQPRLEGGVLLKQTHSFRDVVCSCAQRFGGENIIIVTRRRMVFYSVTNEALIYSFPARERGQLMQVTSEEAWKSGSTPSGTAEGTYKE